MDLARDILIGFILFLMIVVVANLCSNNFTNNVEASMAKPAERFVKIQDWGNNWVMYDRETKVQYFCFAGYDYGGGVTVLVDQDGKPLLYKGE